MGELSFVRYIRTESNHLNLPVSVKFEIFVSFFPTWLSFQHIHQNQKRQITEFKERKKEHNPRYNKKIFS